MARMTGRDRNKGGPAAVLTPPARDVHRAVLAAFAETGRVPARRDLERIARGHGADPDAALAELAGRDVRAFGSDGEIGAASPFSPTATQIEATCAGCPGN